jgi:HlyD family secretion protein
MQASYQIGDGESLSIVMSSSSRKWFWIGLVVAAAAAVGGWAFYRDSRKVEYTTVKVEKGDIESTISATGACNAVVTVQVGSQVSGYIADLKADFNTKVRKGDVVAIIEPSLFQARVDQAKANVDSATAQVGNVRSQISKAESDIASAKAGVLNQKANVIRAQSAVSDAKIKLANRENLFSQGILSKDDRDSAQAVYDQAVASLDAVKAQVTAAEANVKSVEEQREVLKSQLLSAQAQVRQQTAAMAQAQVDLNNTIIRSPVEGTVVKRSMDKGQTVAASFSAPEIFQIAQDLAKMQVDVNVDESDIGRVKEGQQANFTVDAYPGHTFPGVVFQIRHAPMNVQNVITYDVVVRVDNSDLKLFPGMTASVKILTDKLSGTLKVPSAALRFRPADAPTKGGGGGKGRGGGASPMQTVYVLGEDQKPKPVRVRLGPSDGNFVAVVGGDLKEGDRLITAIASGTAPKSTGAPPGFGGGGGGGGRGGPRI